MQVDSEGLQSAAIPRLVLLPMSFELLNLWVRDDGFGDVVPDQAVHMFPHKTLHP